MGEDSHDRYGRIRYRLRDIGAGDAVSCDVDDGMGDVHNGGNDEGLGASKQDNSSFSSGLR